MKAVHEMVMNNNCSWDGDECLLCIRGCILPLFVNFLVIVVLKIFSSNNTVQQKRPADGTQGAGAVKL